ncbi:ferritin-like domain-containing protein [Lichenicola sp.]|uniref:ferritin-like domain-containing protein n=1 Tax=Lichenicola sp. TaxID=2804529 RepID=UPI003B000386
MQQDKTLQTPAMASRRTLLGRAGTGALAAGALAAGIGRTSPATAATDIDVGILNFALNLEYLEGEFYNRGVHGIGLSNIGTPGSVKGGGQVPFTDTLLQKLFTAIALDETNHVAFLRSALGTMAVPEPNIDFTDTFLALGQAIGLPGFNPFADQLSFLLGAYVFEDIGVTAYNGAAPLVTSKTYLGAAASILAVEAYHAGAIRSALYQANYGVYTDRISAIRAEFSRTGPGTGTPSDDAGDDGAAGAVNVAPTDSNSLAFTRTPEQVLAIVFAGGTTSGGFFPNGIQGMFTSSAS